jgi:hypothetical protein
MKRTTCGNALVRAGAILVGVGLVVASAAPGEAYAKKPTSAKVVAKKGSKKHGKGKATQVASSSASPPEITSASAAKPEPASAAKPEPAPAPKSEPAPIAKPTPAAAATPPAPAASPATAPAAAAPTSAGGMVDCTVRANDKDAKCAGEQGTAGSGPKFKGGLTTEINHGFVRGSELIVAVELTGADDDYGGIFSVDLTTGNRKLISGKYNDPVDGEVARGSGKVSLNAVRDVAPGPNGTLIAFAVKNLQATRSILSINPATGDRTVLWDQREGSCAGIPNRDVLFDPGSGIAVGPDGAVYAVLNNNPQGTGKGIAKITGGKCSVITLSGAETTANNKGGGPTMIGSFLYNLTFRNDGLYILQYNTHPSIMKIDPATGNRSIVSSADKGTGHDLAENSMAFAPDGTIWTYQAYKSGFSGLVAVDPSTGNRTVSEPKGGPVKRTQGSDHGLWVHPDGKRLIVQYAKGLFLYDPATGNSNALSY